MSFKFHHKLSLRGLKVTLAGLGVRGRISLRATPCRYPGSPWRPCPGGYALLVDIHRNH